MENATDALMMAASVLLLIIALSVNISSLSSLKMQVDEIISSRNQLQEVKNQATGEYLNYLKSTNQNDVREVGVDAIITSLRRMRKESYVMYVYPKNANSITSLESFLTPDQKSAIIIDVNAANPQKYGLTQIIPKSGQNKIIKFTLAGETGKFIDKDEVINAIYKMAENHTYKEYIGIYQFETAEDFADVNKDTFKVITFVEET